ncbi:SdrD B-like domain-containing protein [Janthinobacterium rivuli]|uniref:SdrD B-like domain-containing protein n=1 Tax=Janthinobacterium sp. FT68W TaxID=2654255 RepID=UPI00186AEA5B|nr:SdrD B-like domain-containing protein [Janthinobacterium sp. FT68W]
MTTYNLSTTVHVCEDINKNFDIRDLLIQAGYSVQGELNIKNFTVLLPDDTESTVNTPLFGMLDADTVYVRPGDWAANYNGSFSTIEVTIDKGNGDLVQLSLQVIIDPVNDAPDASDKTFTLLNGNNVVLSEGDFGFHDDVEHDGFKSIVITNTTTAGQVLLNGVAVAVGTEISIDDIRAGHLVFVPSQTVAGDFDLGFKVRDDGGTAGCNAQDLSLAPHYLTFKVPMAHLGDFVWEDKNANGVQDAGESGIGGVTVQLKNAAGSVIGSTLTDATGYYNFSVDPGTYSIAVVAPAGYLTTVKDAGSSDALDSDINTLGNSGQVTVVAGQNYKDIDAGLYKAASIGDRVWFDANGNGTQDAGEAGVCGVKVNLYNAQGAVVASATTDASGNYLFSNLVPGNYYLGFVPPAGYGFTKADIGGYATDSDVNPATGLTTAWVTLKSGDVQLDWDAGLVKLNTASIGDRVWEDNNYNGVQDTGELGVAGVKVNLLNAYNQVIATTTTNAGGNYLFSALAAGSYKVEVIRPSGFYYTKANVGSDTADSDVDVSTGRSSLINLAAGQNDMSWDAGIYRKASLGDKVWRDADHDGVQDYNEAGIANIKVQLYSGSGVLLATTYTNANGNYLFSNLDPGSYSLKFDKSGVYHAGYAMDTWRWGAKNVGTNDNIDSDVNSNGTTSNVVYTDILKLASGQNDMSWDAAITPIVIDLNGDGVHTIARADFHGSFDLLGTGSAIQTGWVSAQDGLLAIDSNGNGKIDNVAELFGGNEKGTGFAKLSSYDSNHDGVVDAHDDKFAELRIWRDANSNGVTDDGELMSLHDAGVASLTVSYTELPFLDANSNLHLERSSATLADGKSVDMTDVYFNVDAKDAAKAGITLPSMADLLRDDSTLDVVLGQDGTVTTVAAAPAAAGPAAEAQAQAQCEMADLLRRAMAHATTQPQEMAA